MLNTIDTVIAFAVIMTVLSLLITILVQMISATFSLRGKNLANALALTFQTIDPKIGEHAHSLANQVLRDPIFSDSLWREKSRPLLNVAAQEFMEAERQLKDALASKTDDFTRDQIIAAAQERVDELKKKVPKRTVQPNRNTPWGFWSWEWKGATQLSSAIRPGEIYRMLHEIKDMSEMEAILRDIPPDLVNKAAGLIAALQHLDQPAIESQRKLDVISQVSQLFPSPAQQQTALTALNNLGATVERATTQAYDRFQRWFGSAQDRSEQWFQMHVRMATVTFSILIAFFLQLDTVEMFQTLRASPRAVEALTKSASAVLATGKETVQPASTPAQSPEGTQQSLKENAKTVKVLEQTLINADFNILPSGFLRRWSAKDESIFAHFWPHLFGVLMTTGLLTLGAPFWFNLLKNLMSLRPAVANLIEKRPNSAPALPPSPDKPPSVS